MPASKEPKLKRVYVTQYGNWWSYPVKNFLDLCKKAVENDGEYNLDDKYRIKNRPSCIRPHYHEEIGLVSYEEMRNDVSVASPLDWDSLEFELEIKRLAFLYSNCNDDKDGKDSPSGDEKATPTA